MNVKQKLFLLFLAGFLITAPALADSTPPFHVVDPNLGDAVSSFGNKVLEEPSQIVFQTSDFLLSLDVLVYESLDGSTFTYIYRLSQTGTPINITSLQIFNVLYNIDVGPPPTLTNWGWVNAPLVAADGVPPGPGEIAFGETPFSGVTVSGASVTFNLNPGVGSEPLSIWIESDLPPAPIEANFTFFTGEGADFATGDTWGPSDQGEAAGGLYPVPEASSLLLLTFGLLSGGVIRFRVKHRVKNTGSRG